MIHLLLFLHYWLCVDSLYWQCYLYHAHTSVAMFNISPFFHSIVLQEDLHLEDVEKLGQEYNRLHQAMEMVGFLASTKKQYVWFW